jgi:type I restriction enzyme S subunit
LNFDEQRDVEVKWITLEEVGRVSMCKRIMKAETTTGGDVPFYKIGTFGRVPDAYISQEKYIEYYRDKLLTIKEVGA